MTVTSDARGCFGQRPRVGKLGNGLSDLQAVDVAFDVAASKALRRGHDFLRGCGITLETLVLNIRKSVGLATCSSDRFLITVGHLGSLGLWLDHLSAVASLSSIGLSVFSLLETFQYREESPLWGR